MLVCLGKFSSSETSSSKRLCSANVSSLRIFWFFSVMRLEVRVFVVAVVVVVVVVSFVLCIELF